MCEPVTLGALAFGSSALGAIGQHQSASAAARAQNESAVSNYKYQMKIRAAQWNRERVRYANQISQYKQQTLANEEAYSRAVVAEQTRLNNAFKSAAFQNQSSLVQLTKLQGKQAASGATGKSAQRLDNDSLAAFGRNQAIMAENLMSAQSRYRTQNQSLRNELISANNRAFSDVAIAPEPGVAPPRPVMQSGPSSLSLIAGLGNSALQGVSTYNNFKAPGTDIPQPRIPLNAN
jgi:hypothetical protein